jgi:hypothetical protein
MEWLFSIRESVIIVNSFKVIFCAVMSLLLLLASCFSLAKVPFLFGKCETKLFLFALD